MIKGIHIDEAAKIKNTQLATELRLPPVKLHCSMLAEDAIQAAIKDVQKKKKAAVRAVAAGMRVGIARGCGASHCLFLCPSHGRARV